MPKRKHKLDVYAKLVTHTTTFLCNLNKFSTCFEHLRKESNAQLKIQNGEKVGLHLKKDPIYHVKT
jgi:hypothetical protein